MIESKETLSGRNVIHAFILHVAFEIMAKVFRKDVLVVMGARNRLIKNLRSRILIIKYLLSCLYIYETLVVLTVIIYAFCKTILQ